MKIQYKPTKDSDSKEVEVNLDMAKLSDATIRSLAEDAAIVKVQARLRMHDAKIEAGKEDVLPTDWNEFVAPRARMTPIEKAKKMMEGLTKEELAQLLKEAMKK